MDSRKLYLRYDQEKFKRPITESEFCGKGGWEHFALFKSSNLAIYDHRITNIIVIMINAVIH